MHHSSFSWHITPLWILSSYFSCFGSKDPIEIPILRLSIALVKIYHIPVIFQTTSQVFFKFCITFSVMKITPLYFFRSSIILCTFFIAIILNFFVCCYCCKLFVINYVTLLLKWCIVYLVFYPVLMLHVWGNFSYNICSNKVKNKIKN